MQETYRSYLRKRWQWSIRGVGGTTSWVSLGIGGLIAALFWVCPNWTRAHISDQMNAFVSGLIPLCAGASVLIVRWLFFSPYFVFKTQEVKHAQKYDLLIKEGRTRQSENEKTINDLQQQVDRRQRRRNLADRLGYAMEEGRLLGANHSGEEEEKWIHGTVNPILTEIGHGAFARFNAATHEARSLYPTSPAIPVLNARLKILNQFIQELMQPE
jgi:hypothetical protein